MKKNKILFFVGGIFSGGKERRLLELMAYLRKKSDYELLLVTTSKEVHYEKFYELNVPLVDISKNGTISKYKYPYELIKICRNYNPNIIHTWGRFQAFYAIPAKIILKIALVNGQITNATPVKSLFHKYVDQINFMLSDKIVANSQAGINLYKPPTKKTSIISNGFNLERFENLLPEKEVKRIYHLNKPFVILMAATFSKNKDHDRFFELAEYVSNFRNDILFVSAGYYDLKELPTKAIISKYEKHPQIKILGMVKDIENLIMVSDICILFSNSKVHGEGLSNSILEYLALGKPVIANDSGGTKEIVKSGINGILVNGESIEEIGNILLEWLNDPDQRIKLGKNGKHMVQSLYSIDIMGKAFMDLYESLTR